MKEQESPTVAFENLFYPCSIIIDIAIFVIIDITVIIFIIIDINIIIDIIVINITILR